MDWNLRGELACMGSTETTAESGVRGGDLVTISSLPTRTDRDSVVGGAQGVPVLKRATYPNS